MGRRRLAYYAHPIDIYNTKLEQTDLEMIEKLGYDACNPNTPESRDAYAKRGMAHFCDLVQTCDLVIFRAFPDGCIGAGIDKEISAGKGIGLPVMELPYPVDLPMIEEPDLSDLRRLDVPRTRKHLDGALCQRTELGLAG